MNKPRFAPLFLALLICLALFPAQPAIAQPAPEGALFVNQGRLKPVYEARDDGSAQVGEVSKGQAFTLLERDGKWASVAYVDPAGRAREGYIKDSNLQPQPADYGFAFIRSTDMMSKVPLRRSAKKSGTVIAKYFSGVRAQLLEARGEKYTRVLIGGLMGYIESAFLVPHLPADAPAPLIPSAAVQNPEGHSLTLRAEPNYKAEKLKGYPNGTEVQVLGMTEEFAQVLTSQGRTGFMMASALSPAPVYADLDPEDITVRPEGYTSVIDNKDGEGAHLRRKGSTASESMGLYRNGTEVVVTGGTSWWKKVWVEGHTGYMMAKLIRGFEPTEGEDYVEPPIDWTLEEFQNPPGWDGVDAPEGN